MRLCSETALLLLCSCNLPVFIKSMKDDLNSSLMAKRISLYCCSFSLWLFYPLTFYLSFTPTVSGWNLLKSIYFWTALMNKKANLTSCRVQDEVVAKIMGLSGTPSATDTRPWDKAVLSPSPLGSLLSVATFLSFLDSLCNPRNPDRFSGQTEKSVTQCMPAAEQEVSSAATVHTECSVALQGCSEENSHFCNSPGECFFSSGAVLQLCFNSFCLKHNF